jgi:hypothetical protein
MSDRLVAALQGGGTVATELEFFQRDDSIAVLSGLILEGTVTAERQTVRRHCDLTIIDREHTLTPSEASDLFGAWGRYEFQVKRGIQFPDGSSELVPLGMFRIEEIDGQWPSLTVRAYDRMYQIGLNEFTVPYVINGSRLGSGATNVVDAIVDLFTDRWGRPLEVNAVTTEHTTGESQIVYEEGGNPADAGVQLGASAGLQVFFNQVGVLTILEEPDPTEMPPAWRFVEGEAGTTLLSGLARRTVTEGVYNGVVATGESTDDTPPVRGEWWDYNPASPTYVLSFGRRPRRYSSPLLKTTAQATSAARKIGLASLGLTDAIQFPSLVVPGLDVGDVAYVRRPVQFVDDHHVLDHLSFQLRAQGSMNVQTRSVERESLAE